MKKIRTIDSEEIARDYVQTFKDRPASKRTQYDFSWPAYWQNVGDSLAVAYASDKWKKPGDFELYKHLAESRNRCFVQPGLLRDWDTNDPMPVVGPMCDFSRLPLPKHFATLGFFEEANLKLHTGGSDDKPRFAPNGDKDEGVVAVVIRHAYLGASMLRWSEIGDYEDQPFLFVYTNKDGPLIFIVGQKLDIEKDGIVG